MSAAPYRRYANGRAHEYRIAEALELAGYWCVRAAGSKGKADIVALKPLERPLLVQVKQSGPQISPQERQELYGAATASGAVPVVAHKPSRQPIHWRELTGIGPKDWIPWEPSIALNAIII